MPVFQYVALAKVRPPVHDLRADLEPEALGQLADSMATEGLKQPIGVRTLPGGDEYETMWGNRRRLAARSLGWELIGAMVYPADADPFLAGVHENLIRVDLSPLDEARLCGELAAHGRTPAQSARLLRRSVEWVKTRLGILAAPPDIQAAIHEGTIPLGVAYALAAIDHAGYRAELIEQAARLGATVPVAQVWLAEWARDRAQLIRSHDAVKEIIRRAQEVQELTDCQGCQRRVPWKRVYTLRLCDDCHGAVEAVIAAEPGPPAPPGP